MLQDKTTPQDKLTAAPPDEIIVDGARLRRALRRQGRLWLWLGPLAAAAATLMLGALVPKSYTAQTSVALQQPSSPNSTLALLTGGGGGSASNRYLGILKSRALAASVERHVQLQQVYGAKTFRTEEDAIELLAKSVKPEDSPADGLLYISVTLPGPPKFAVHPSPSVTQVEDAAALAANDYAAALKEYYATSDTDQGAVLLRGADKAVRDQRASYNAALARAQRFTLSLSRVDPRSAPSASSAAGASSPDASTSDTAAPGRSSGSGGTDAATAASGLAGLYAAQDNVEAELSSVQASQAAGQQLVGSQLRDLANIPTDDPLLANARARVTQDQSAYDAASRLYGPENPAVITAQTRLDVDRAELDRQIQGVKRSLTTPDVRTTQEITGLTARQAKLTQQIADAERHLGISRRLSGEAGRLQAEVGIQLDLLKATLNEAEKIKLDNAASLNRLAVVDPALPPKSGEPGLGKFAGICLALAFLAFLVAVAREYLRPAPKPAGDSRPAALPPVHGNGSGTFSAEDKEDAALRAAQK